MTTTKNEEKCSACQRGPIFFEGCSVVECPKRKAWGAEQDDYAQGNADALCTGCYRLGSIPRESTE